MRDLQGDRASPGGSPALVPRTLAQSSPQQRSESGSSLHRLNFVSLTHLHASLLILGGTVNAGSSAAHSCCRGALSKRRRQHKVTVPLPVAVFLHRGV